MFLDIRAVVSAGGERGLLGFAFAPDAAMSRRFYVNFTNLDGHTVIARYTRTAEGAVEPDSRFDLMWPDGRRFIEQPFSNHNGGHLAFGPDGYLYIGMGDGGSGGDPLNNAQNPNTLLGKMLRIDVNVPDTDARGYRVPDDNPFVDRQPIAALGEIWAFGLRNPWRYNFDDWTHGGTGALVIADVGQTAHEEVNWEPAGAGGRNYGWRLREGRVAYDARTAGRLPAADRADSRLPAHRRHVDHRRLRLSRRGAEPDVQWPLLLRRLCRWTHLHDRPGARRAAGSAGRRSARSHRDAGGASELGLISSFGVDANAELYLVSYSRGRILKIVPQ